MAVSEKKEHGKNAPAHLTKLRDRVQQATKLIGELRESNYALSGELAETKRELDALRAKGDSQEKDEEAENGAADGDTSEVKEELDALRSERRLIREKVKTLLEKLDRLET